MDTQTTQKVEVSFVHTSPEFFHFHIVFTFNVLTVFSVQSGSFSMVQMDTGARLQMVSDVND